MGAQNDRVIARQRFDQAARFGNLLRIQAGRGLVQDQHVGIVDDRLGESNSLPVALR
jgi:hypothetical protein